VDIIYSDNHLLIVNKRGGVPTQETPHRSENVTDWAKDWVKRNYQKAGSVFLEPFHRLDQPVSGLVLFARTSKGLSRLQKMMRERQISKWYYALLRKPPPAAEAVLEHILFHDEHRARVVSSSHPEGKQAILSYQTLKQTPSGYLLEIKLQTGRYHQIRAQLAHIGCPIIGDKKYGSSVSWNKDTIALHHGKLLFTHPITKKELTFSAPFRINPGSREHPIYHFP